MKDAQETNAPRVIGTITGTALVAVPMKSELIKGGSGNPADVYASYVAAAVREMMAKYGAPPQRISVSMRFDDDER